MGNDLEAVIAEMRAKAAACPSAFDTLGKLYGQWADRIARGVAVLEADRDNWRKQALTENARADALEARITELEARHAN